MPVLGRWPRSLATMIPHFKIIGVLFEFQTYSLFLIGNRHGCSITIITINATCIALLAYRQTTYTKEKNL